jgi:glycosyltransferase involved in cell wall biosynthesis
MSTGVLFTNTEGEFIEKFTQKKLTCYSAGLAGGYDVSPNKYRKVLDLFRQYQVLHFHGFNPLLATCAAASGKPVVYTEHGNFAIGRKTGIAGAVKSALLSVFLNRFADYVTFNSGFTRGIAEARYGLQDTPGSVVYNGIAVDEIAGSTRPIDPAIAGKLESRFVVGTSSRFAGFKRIDRLIDAFATFQHGKPDAMLLLVGDGALRAKSKDTGYLKKRFSPVTGTTSPITRTAWMSASSPRHRSLSASPPWRPCCSGNPRSSAMMAAVSSRSWEAYRPPTW